jgi:ABC-type branched-subunit amino acid transport system permease subunit
LAKEEIMRHVGLFLFSSALALWLLELHLLIFGALFILVVLFLPGGLVEAWSRTRGLIARRG